jgi:hypothetical protein
MVGAAHSHSSDRVDFFEALGEEMDKVADI